MSALLPVCSTKLSDISPQNCCTKSALRVVLGSEAALRGLVQFSARQYNEENVMCWVAIRAFKAAARAGDAPPRLRALADDIIKQVRHGVVC